MVQPKLLLVVVLIISFSFVGCMEDADHYPPTTSSPTSTAYSPPGGSELRTAIVTKVVDGDTIEVKFANGTVDTVRLLGVDTPETITSNEDPSEFDVPDTATGHDWLLRWGREAKTYAEEVLNGTEVSVVSDPEADRRGSFGRLLAYIYVDGKNFNHELITRGLARRYDDSSFTYREEFGQTENKARAENRGVRGFSQARTNQTTEPPDSRDCSDFGSQQAAQEFFENHNPDEDPYRLDADSNGQACESLP